jgi:hypothetical protein
MTLVRLAAGVAVVAALSLTGCSEARRALGYDKAPPDEFAVMARAPLAQPPDFTLRPPMPGATRPQEGTVRDQAKSVLVPGRAGLALGGSSGLSPGEQLILSKAGADQADPGIRRKVDEETTALIQADNSFTDKILFWQDKPAPGEVLDSTKEAKRLQQNASAGKAPSEGGSPQIIRREKGWLEGIF